MPKPISLQLYTLRELAAKDFTSVLKTVAKIGYTGVEFAGLHNQPAKDVRKVLDSEGLVASSGHVAVLDPSKWQQVEDDAKALGYNKLVGGFWIPDLEGEKLKASADKVNAAINHFGPKGFTVHLHNHWFEYDSVGNGHKLAALCPKLFLQLDVYWIKTGGADPAEVVQRYARRVQMLHIKDGPCVREKPMTAVGKGIVDVAACVRAGEKGALEWNVVELDDCATDMTEAVRDSYKFMISKGLATGKK